MFIGTIGRRKISTSVGARCYLLEKKIKFFLQSKRPRRKTVEGFRRCLWRSLSIVWGGTFFTEGFERGKGNSRLPEI